LLAYLCDPSAKVDKNVRQSAFKYVLHNDELYRRTAEDLLLKCLGPDEARVAMGEVHEGICGTHQSAPKMKWLLQRAGFYWPTLMSDCFRYYKGCEEYQRFGNIQLVTIAMLHPIIKSWPFCSWGLSRHRPNYKSTSIKTITEVIKFSHLSPYNSGSPIKS
jgi:hypothetical protein